MVLISGCVHAQEQSEVVEKALFQNAVDYVNCKLMELSLKGQGAVGESFKQKCPCDNRPVFSGIKKGFPAGLSKTAALADEINTIKKRAFKEGTEKKDVIDLLTNTIFLNDDYPKLKAFAEGRKNDTDFGSLKIEMKNRLSEILTPVLEGAANTSITIDAATETDRLAILGDSITQLNNRIQGLEKTADSWYNGLLFRIALIAGISILVFFVIKFFTVISNDEDDVTDEIKKYVRSEILIKQGNAGNFMTADLRELQDHIRRVESKVEDAANISQRSQPYKEISQVVFEDEPKPYNKQENIPSSPAEVLYFSTPNEDGSFNVSAASTSFMDDASIYRMTKTSAAKAEYKIDDRPSAIRLALQYPELRIERCCIPQNAFNHKAKRIVTRKPGKMELMGDKWIIVTKAKISYED